MLRCRFCGQKGFNLVHRHTIQTMMYHKPTRLRGMQGHATRGCIPLNTPLGDSQKLLRREHAVLSKGEQKWPQLVIECLTLKFYSRIENQDRWFQGMCRNFD